MVVMIKETDAEATVLVMVVETMLVVIRMTTRREGKRMMTTMIEVRSARKVVTTIKVLVMRKKMGRRYRMRCPRVGCLGDEVEGRWE